MDAAAYQEHRLLGPVEHRHGLFDLAGVGGGVGLIPPDRHLLGVDGASHLLLDILGQVHHHRPRLAGTGNIEGFPEHTAQVFPVPDDDGILADIPADPHHIHFLEGIVSDEAPGDLPRNADQGHAVIVGVGDSGDQVGGTGAAGDQADPYLSGGPGIPVRRKDEPLLMAGQDHLNVILAIECVEQVDGHSSGIGKHGVHPFRTKGLHHQIRSPDLRQFFTHGLSLFSSLWQSDFFLLRRQ